MAYKVILSLEVTQDGAEFCKTTNEYANLDLQSVLEFEKLGVEMQGRMLEWGNINAREKLGKA